MPYISPEHRDKQKTVKEGTEDVKKVWNSSSAEQLREDSPHWRAL